MSRAATARGEQQIPQRRRRGFSHRPDGERAQFSEPVGRGWRRGPKCDHEKASVRAGNIPGQFTHPVIKSVTFSHLGANVNIFVTGRGFGPGYGESGWAVLKGDPVIIALWNSEYSTTPVCAADRVCRRPALMLAARFLVSPWRPARP
jgi:hypothetical protein